MRGKRKSIRLKGHDYTQNGAYYVTICTHERKCLFGDIKDGSMALNECGKIADKCWNEIPAHFPHVDLDEYIVMPNHVHGIINIVDNIGVGANNYSPLQIKQTFPPVFNSFRFKFWRISKEIL